MTSDSIRRSFHASHPHYSRIIEMSRSHPTSSYSPYAIVIYYNTVHPLSPYSVRASLISVSVPYKWQLRIGNRPATLDPAQKHVAHAAGRSLGFHAESAVAGLISRGEGRKTNPCEGRCMEDRGCTCQRLPVCGLYYCLRRGGVS